MHTANDTKTSEHLKLLVTVVPHFAMNIPTQKACAKKYSINVHHENQLISILSSFCEKNQPHYSHV